MSFGFVGGWDRKLLHDPLDAKMTAMTQRGEREAKDRVHKVTWRLYNSIGSGYNKAEKRAMVWADEKYAWVEEMRGPSHAYLGPAMQAMAGFWGGTYTYEAHFMNAAPMGRNTTLQDVQAKEKRWRKQNFNILQRRKVKVVTRRWHQRFDMPSNDTPTPII